MKNEEKTIIKPLTLVIRSDIWEDFKNKVPRTKTLNEAVIELIEKFNNEN